MRSAAPLLALTALVAPAAMAQPHDRSSVVWSPPMIDVPTPEQIMAVRPARAAGLEGRVWGQIKCGFTAEGRLVDCAPVQSSHPGLGLEQAVVSLADRFRLEPRFVQRWMGASVVFTVSFGPPWAEPPAPPVLSLPPVEARRPAAPVQLPPPGGLIARPDWVRKPSAVAIERAFPEAALKAQETGWAVIECTIKPDGGMEACIVTAEQPQGLGFGDAALALGRMYKVKPFAEDGQSFAGRKVRAVIDFTLPVSE